MSDETHGEKIARIDANVQVLLGSLPKIHQLDKESATNKTEHRIALAIAGVVGTPLLLWLCKTLGVPLF